MSDVSPTSKRGSRGSSSITSLRGERCAVDVLCGGRPDLAGRSTRSSSAILLDRLPRLDDARTVSDGTECGRATAMLPAFDGFQTIERIGAGGMGEVYKLRDLRLDRIVAAKVIRRDRARAGAPRLQFLREARALALFSDRRIVQILEFRPEPDPPVIIMEYVDGFELGRHRPLARVRAARAGPRSKSARRCTTRTRSACSTAI